MGIAQPIDVAKARPIGRSAQAVSSKLLGLELLRFASAIAVLMFHYRHFAQLAGMPPVARSAVPFYSLLWPLYEYGQFGVQLFWGISGYIFFWKYGAAIHSTAISAARFAWLRFSRLYPLHLATLVTVVGLQAIHRHLTGTDFVYPSQEPGQFVRHLFLASDWGAQEPFSFNGPIWSVSAEVAVYAAFFLALRRFAPSLALCLAAVIAGLGLQWSGFDSVPVACATYFFAGGIAAVLPPADFKARLGAGGVLATLLVGTAGAGTLGDRGILPTILLVALPLMMIVLTGQWPIADRWHKPIEAAGNLTYSTYLLHFPLQLALAIGVAGSGFLPDLTSGTFLLCYLGITLAAGAISYRRFEVPLQDWLRRAVP